MGLATKLASDMPMVIKQALFSLLDEITDADVINLDQRFRTIPHEMKHAFFAEFETSFSKPPRLSPFLLERWTHYCWIRLELTYLINQKAALNKITKNKNNIDTLLQSPDEPEAAFEEPRFANKALRIPAMIDSVDLAIQEDAQRGVPIEQSIRVLEKMMLQIVGTEHPTDPLSQDARDTLTKIANAIDEIEPDESDIKKLLADLQTIDAIPPTKRSVVEEVNRNIHITLEKLYDNLPHLIRTILNAYQKYYGEAAYHAHEADIIQAIEGGKMSDGTIRPPLLRDASWPAFDADGNENVTATTMSTGIRLYRIRVAEKHIETIKSTLSKSAKKIEQELREKIVLLNANFFKLLVTPNSDIDILGSYEFQNQASHFLIDRKFHALSGHYQKFSHYIENLALDQEKQTQLLNVIKEQLETASKLVELTQFSGNYRDNEVLRDGDIQKFKKIFSAYKNAIRENTDAITIKNEHGHATDALSFVSSHFNDLKKTHENLLKTYPELNQQMRDFSIQLHCFGMTYGVGHLRQDSSIFMKVWNAILSDLQSEEIFSQFALFQPMKQKTYLQLSEDERIILHKQLQDNSHESKKILHNLFHKHHDSIYLSHVKYKNNPEFQLVRSELDRLDLAIRHEDMFENIIISNCESAANILEVESLLCIFPKRTSVTIVPLLEKRQDLEKYEAILLDYIKLRIQQKLEKDFDNEAHIKLKEILGIQSKAEIKHWVESKNRHDFHIFLANNAKLRPYLLDITIEIMVGFSDTERVSGISALIAVQQVQEDFIKLTSEFGVTPKIYHGPGGDANRGGLKRRDQKGTLQGNARSNVLNTAKSTQWFRENQFYHTYKMLSDSSKQMEFAKLSQPMQECLVTCMQKGTWFYENLHDTKAGLGKLTGLLLGQGSHWLVTILNSSSRATQRGVTEGTGDRTASVQSNADGMRAEAYIHPDKPRAITATQMKEMLRDNLDFIGSAYGLRAIGQKNVERLYDLSETFRDMLDKNLLGAASRDLSFIAHALFADHPELLPQNESQKMEWAAECRETYSTLLKNMDIEKLSNDLEKNRTLLLTYLSRLFAYINQECQQTQAFLFEINRSIHRIAFKKANPQLATDLLSHCKPWQEQTTDVIHEAEPLSLMFARLSHHVANGKDLDKIFQGLNKQIIPDSKLSGIGRLLGNVGAGITAYRIMQPGFTENIHHDIRDNLRPGHTRAEQEMREIKKDTTSVNSRYSSVLRFFSDSIINTLNNTLEKRPETKEQYRL